MRADCSFLTFLIIGFAMISSFLKFINILLPCSTFLLLTFYLMWLFYNQLVLSSTCMFHSTQIRLGNNSLLHLFTKKHIYMLSILSYIYSPKKRKQNLIWTIYSNIKQIIKVLLFHRKFIIFFFKVSQQLFIISSRTLTFQNFLFLFASMIALQKWWKMLFISP